MPKHWDDTLPGGDYSQITMFVQLWNELRYDVGKP
ncbi:hypothetical protein WD_0349 [Wolbachia endosymbiont of Drosophila melanogaster]|nr:hypothetical protein WD_0349 [Wolbachia endosymbiont of Drosophila melanogaster]